jgi:hypothetical protein
MATSVKLVGMERLNRVLAEGSGRHNQLPRSVGKALYEEALLIMDRSRDQVPVDLGTLQGSGKVDMPRIDGGKISVELSYGGNASAYALYVHEVDMPHRKGKAFYLRDPVEDAVPELAERIADRIEQDLKGA